MKWQFKSIEANVWVKKDILIEMGYKKLIEREVTQPGDEKHLGDFGVNPESVNHTRHHQPRQHGRDHAMIASRCEPFDKRLKRVTALSGKDKKKAIKELEKAEGGQEEKDV